MIPREGALAELARFCIKHSQQGKIGTFTSDHIMEMARLILDNNCFAYNNKYYTTCPSVTESRFFALYSQYLHGTTSNEANIFRIYVSLAALQLLNKNFSSTISVMQNLSIQKL
jgi:hypothetical protein